MGKFIVGQLYTYTTKEMCIMVANRAKAEGFEVRFGTFGPGQYYFEIVDPFDTKKGW